MKLDKWQALRAESDAKAPQWARYMMQHCPGFGHAVIEGLPLRHVVETISGWTGCDPDTCEHDFTATLEDLLAATR